ncbi:MAG: N-acyl homoserine lactonase family protein [Chloroflexota bacterium]
MANYSIRPIPLCEGPRDASMYAYRLPPGTPTKAVCYSWYIEGSKPRIMVDTGLTTAMAPRSFPTALNTPEAALARLGLKPDDIEIVIVTHLHFDHIGLGHLYRKARFIVQKKELDYARNPHPMEAHLYDRSMFEDLDFEVVNGRKRIIPGVSVLLTPGHSPGGQSVVINTSAGKAIITGFCCQLRTFEPTEAMKQQGWEASAPMLHQDVRDVYDSVLKVKRRADIIIAQHDPSFVEKDRIP